jgi:hypothetical protein
MAHVRVLGQSAMRVVGPTVLCTPYQPSGTRSFVGDEPLPVVMEGSCDEESNVGALL